MAELLLDYRSGELGRRGMAERVAPILPSPRGDDQRNSLVPLAGFAFAVKCRDADVCGEREAASAVLR
jgi:hypothetical protein